MQTGCMGGGHPCVRFFIVLKMKPDSIIANAKANCFTPKDLHPHSLS